MLKNILLSSAFAAAALPALAADLPSRTTAPAPYVPPAPVFTWTGFYIGLNAGYNWGNNDLTLYANPVYAAYFPTGVKTDSDGFTGGIQAGYNWQMNQFVLGVEGDWVWLDSGKTGSATIAYPSGYPGAGVGGASVTSTGKIGSDWLATLRARVGYAMDRWMIYGTGGLAWGNVSSSSSLSASYINAAGVSTLDLWQGKNDDTRFGWTLGAGVEYAITNNFTTKLEYLYYDLGSKNYAVVGGTLPAAAARAKMDGNIIRAGLNYKF
jgi:outer membrane immunogenic protein